MQAHHIRPGVPADTNAVYKIHEAAFLDTYPNPDHGVTTTVLNHFLAESAFEQRKLHEWRQGLEQPGIFVACKGARQIGFIAVAASQQGQGAINALYISSEHRGEGIGTSLLKTGEDYLIEAGQTTASLEVVAWTRAIDFYQGHGYTPTGRKVQNPVLAPNVELELVQLSRTLPQQDGLPTKSPEEMPNFWQP